MILGGNRDFLMGIEDIKRNTWGWGLNFNLFCFIISF